MAHRNQPPSNLENYLKPVSVKTNSGQMHLSAVDHVGAAVLAHVVLSAQMAQMHLSAVIFN